jgi:hypothetical protein
MFIAGQRIAAEATLQIKRTAEGATPTSVTASPATPAKRQPQNRKEKARATLKRDEKIQATGHKLRKKGKSIAEAASEMEINPAFAGVSKERLQRLIGGRLK